MVFSGEVFLILFLPISVFLYYAIVGICKKNMTVPNLWLLFVSLGFYAWGEYIYVFLMMFSIFINYLFGLWLSNYSKTPKGKRIVALACVFNLGLLFVFKYLGWVLGLAVRGYSGVFADLALPLGISFYTFQALSYVVDVYRGKDEAQRNIINVGLYIAFFPQLVAGPIVRYGTVAKQLQNREHTVDGFTEGVWRFGVGLAKKILVANQLGQITDLTFRTTGENLSVVLAWVGAVSFMLQIYFDFSGYSDMAIGLGRMFGFKFNENFNYPLVSTSLTELWRRWHISLGEWFRDYLYYPLSLGPAISVKKFFLKRFGRKEAQFASTAFVFFVVWMATGLWHGADLTFVVWGFFQFVCILIEQYRKPFKNKKIGTAIGFCTTIMINIAMGILFNAENMGVALSYYKDMLHISGNAVMDSAASYWIGQYAVIIVAGIIFAFPVVPAINRFVKKNKVLEKVWNGVKLVSMSVSFVICLTYAISAGYNPFIYFNF